MEAAVDTEGYLVPTASVRHNYIDILADTIRDMYIHPPLPNPDPGNITSRPTSVKVPMSDHLLHLHDLMVVIADERAGSQQRLSTVSNKSVISNSDKEDFADRNPRYDFLRLGDPHHTRENKGYSALRQRLEHRYEKINVSPDGEIHMPQSVPDEGMPGEALSSPGGCDPDTSSSGQDSQSTASSSAVLIRDSQLPQT